MTLQELSPQYAADAAAITQRIRELSVLMEQCHDPGEIQRLSRRIGDLRPLERQSKELAKLTRKYYDRRYHPYAQYTL